MAISTRTRFEVFKRDGFTCQYCGRKSPEVVLEIDHIRPLCEGGTDDRLNLSTSCWECNRGKSGNPLNEITTSEDPHDAAVLLLERRRQLDEYNEVLAADRARRLADYQELCKYWTKNLRPNDDNWLFDILKYVPIEAIRDAMDIAIKNRKTQNLAYVNAILRRWKEEHSSDDPE